MQVESEGQVEKDKVQVDRASGSKGDIGKKEVGQRAGGKEHVEDDGQNRSEDRSGEDKKQQKSHSFFDLCHVWIPFPDSFQVNFLKGYSRA